MTLHDSFGGAYSYLRNIRSRKMTTIQIPLAEYEKLKADAERLKQALENVQSEIRSVAGTLMDSVFSHQTQGGWLHQEALALERCLIAIDAAIKQEVGA
jgi:uncharacterized protein YukE